MKTLILYSTKSGSTRQCAELLAARFTDSECHDVKDGAALVEEAELVILGSGVHAARMYKAIRAFMDKHSDLLLARKLAIFSCNALDDTLPEIIKKNIPQKLVDHAVCIESFGGKKPFAKTVNMEWLHQEAFDAFVAKVTDALDK